ncbi:GL18761 [Drosophila persimilis]|uniref:GL18761 n=1 Tax=Drosophila persimilis TaxID=7234 RepID=B4G8V1_DROPE|nr:GL18761 [Drosophila persimilis]
MAATDADAAADAALDLKVEPTGLAILQPRLASVGGDIDMSSDPLIPPHPIRNGFRAING